MSRGRSAWLDSVIPAQAQHMQGRLAGIHAAQRRLHGNDKPGRAKGKAAGDASRRVGDGAVPNHLFPERIGPSRIR